MYEYIITCGLYIAYCFYVGSNAKYSQTFFEIRVCSGNGSVENQEFLMIYVENLRKEFKKTVKEPGLKGSLKSFIKPKKEIVAAVKDISFEVQEGEILGFIGPNGAGKSTVIKMLTGILSPTSGKCTINGKDPQKDRKTYVKEIGVVFGQRTQLWWDLPLTETYTVLKEIYEVDDSRFKKRMGFLNEVLELDSFINSPVRTLSLGQRMRADIAASLLHSPKVLFREVDCMFREIKRALKMHRIFIVQELKRFTEYKGDFLTGAVGLLLAQLCNIVFISVIFGQIPELMGWKYNEVMFIYGFSLIPKALDHLFFDNLWSVGYFIVRKGDFDKYLTRPINPLFHVMAEKFQVDAFGEMVIGIILLSCSLPSIEVEWGIGKILLVIVAIIFASFIYTGIKVGTAAIAFWTKRSGNITFMFYMVNDFVKYPIDIYNNVVRSVLTYIIPFAFTSYFPALYFLTGENPIFNIGMTIVVALIVMTIGVLIWNRGIKAYESAGS